MDLLSVKGNQIVDAQGREVRLRGTCVGGWMNMEDFINAYPGAEHQLRATLARELGPGKAAFFFERLLDHFFTEEDVAFIKSLGATVVRLPLNYRHFERDDRPFEYLEGWFCPPRPRGGMVRETRPVRDPRPARRAGLAKHRLAQR